MALGVHAVDGLRSTFGLSGRYANVPADTDFEWRMRAAGRFAR
jgi:hypothetical protein